MDRLRPGGLWRRLGPMALVTLCVTLPPATQALNLQLPDMGDPTEQVLSPEQDAKLGEAFMRQVRRATRIVQDPEVDGYINALGGRLVSTGGAGGRQFHFFVVDDARINAFAGPGGYIGVNTGLIAAAETESELAAVLAHEAAHVIQRHIARQIQQAQEMSLPAMAALLAAIVIAGSAGGDVGTAAVAAVTAGTAQMQINFTRANEKEADRVGIQLLADAGFDSYGMPEFFRKLQTSSRYYSKPPEFLSTHPVTPNRIAEAEDRASQMGHKGTRDSLQFELIKARLHLLTQVNPRESLRYFQRLLEGGQYREEDAVRYGLAVSETATGDYGKARRELQGLVKRRGDLPLLLSAQARNELAAGDRDAAIGIYRRALKLYPGEYALTVALSETLLGGGETRQARDLLRALSRNHPESPLVYRLLAQAHGALGEWVESRRAQAEFEYLNGNLEGAIQQLKLAKKEAKGSFYASATVDARLAELEALEREEKKNGERRR